MPSLDQEFAVQMELEIRASAPRGRVSVEWEDAQVIEQCAKSLNEYSTRLVLACLRNSAQWEAEMDTLRDLIVVVQKAVDAARAGLASASTPQAGVRAIARGIEQLRSKGVVV